MGVPAESLSLSGSSQLLRAGTGVYRGFVLRETAGNAATVRIYDATSAGGMLLDDVRMAANETARDFYSDGGLMIQHGLYVEVTGAVEGSVRLG